MSRCRCNVCTTPFALLVDTFSFRQSLILLLRVVSFLSASSISFDNVMNNKSDDDDDDEDGALVDVGVDGWLLVDLDPYDATEKLLHSLLKPTNLVSISFSSCRACFLRANRKKKESTQLRKIFFFLEWLTFPVVRVRVGQI